MISDRDETARRHGAPDGPCRQAVSSRSDKVAELQSGRGRAAVGHFVTMDSLFSQVRSRLDTPSKTLALRIVYTVLRDNST